MSFVGNREKMESQERKRTTTAEAEAALRTVQTADVQRAYHVDPFSHDPALGLPGPQRQVASGAIHAARFNVGRRNRGVRIGETAMVGVCPGGGPWRYQPNVTAESTGQEAAREHDRASHMGGGACLWCCRPDGCWVAVHRAGIIPRLVCTTNDPGRQDAAGSA